jgi:hypothetical protein
MKKILKIIVIILFIVLVVIVVPNVIHQKNLDNEIKTTQNVSEDSNMRREFCTVVSAGDIFMLKNTQDEIYNIDLSLKGDFSLGDAVLLLYKERTKNDDGYYEVSECKIYKDNLTLEPLEY